MILRASNFKVLVSEKAIFIQLLINDELCILDKIVEMLLKSIKLLVAKSSKQCMQSFGDWPVYYGKYWMTKQVMYNCFIRGLSF